MQNIATAGFFDWTQETSGAGYVNSKATGWECGAAIGEKAYFSKHLPARPGEKITLRVMARLISGTPGNEPGLAIDYPFGGQLQNSVPVTSHNWEQYSISFTVPISAKVETEAVKLVVGSWSSTSGTIEVGAVEVCVENAAVPMARVWAAGLLVFGSAGVGLNSNFCSIGIRNIRLSSDSLTMYVDVGKLPYPNVDYPGLGPIFNVQVTADTPTLFARTGRYNRATGEIEVSVYENSSDGSTKRNLTTATVTADGRGFIWFTAIGL